MNTTATDSIRVLHVDDESDFAELTAVFLEREHESLTVETASDAEEARRRLATGSFDCVVSDYDMPRQNGIEFLESVREERPALPFILFTGKGSEEVASDAISAGVTDYLQKETGTDQYAVLANRIANAVEHYRSQRMVERSERRLREIIDSLPHFLYVIDEAGTYLLANESLAEFHGATVDGIEGASLDEVLAAPVAERFEEHVEDVLASDAPKTFSEVEITDPDGDVRVFEPRLLPYDFGDTDAPAVLGIAAEVTEREERERALERTRERMQLALERTDSIVFEIDLDTRDIVRHGEFEAFFGLPAESVPTWESHLGRAVHPDDCDRFRRFYRQLLDGDRDAGQIDYRTNPERGRVRWIRDTVSIEADPETGARQAVGIARDITADQERKLELERKERRYQAIFDDPNILVGLIDTDGTVLDINRTAMDYVDAAREDVLGRPLWRTPWFDHSAAIREDVETWIDRAAGGEYVEFEVDLVGPSGDPYTIDGVFRPVTNADGEVVSLVISDREITEQKGYERELERTNALLSTLFDALPVGLLAEDERRDVAAVNEQMFELLDLPGTPTDLRGSDCVRLAEEISEMLADSGAFVERLDEIVAEREPVRDEALSLRDGRTYLRSYHPIELPEEAGHLWVYRDDTDRVEHEARLEALHETTRELMAADTFESVAEIGAAAVRDILNADANTIHRYDGERSALVPVARSDAIRRLVGEPPAFSEGDSIAWRVYETGEAVAIDDVRDDPDVYDPDTPVRSELYLPIEGYGILIAGSPTPGAFDQRDVVLGKILAGNVATALDQVERTQQLRARGAQLTRQNDRLEEFVSVVSHDLRNPLQVAKGRLALAMEESDDEQLADVDRALDRMDTLIDDLLTLAREGECARDLEPVDLAECVRHCWFTVETDDATLDIDVDRTVRADRSRLQQLFENLFRNAAEHGSTSRQRSADDAVEHGSTSSRRPVADAAEHGAAADRTGPGGDGVTVTVGDLETGFYVEDDGPGIPPDDRESIFQAGYTTSPDGTGFGLSIVAEIVDAHGWRIAVADGETGGARFEITGVDE